MPDISQMHTDNVQNTMHKAWNIQAFNFDIFFLFSYN
jgi:hypothetical protein